MTRAFRAYEPAESLDHETEELGLEHVDHMNVLWGRVVVLCIALLVAFSVGRMTVAAGPAEGDVDRLREQLAAAQQEAADLQAEIEARDALAAATAERQGEAVDEVADTTEDPVTKEPATYTVKKGDTLRQIAQRLCGDPNMAGSIAQLNGVRDATALGVGQSLRLPAGCTA